MRGAGRTACFLTSLMFCQLIATAADADSSFSTTEASVKKGSHDTGQAIARGAHAAGHAISTGAHAVTNAVERGARRIHHAFVSPSPQMDRVVARTRRQRPQNWSHGPRARKHRSLVVGTS
jgi:hypothetical protein